MKRVQLLVGARNVIRYCVAFEGLVLYKLIGASPAGNFFGGGRGRFGKKGVMLRGLRISEKK